MRRFAVVTALALAAFHMGVGQATAATDADSTLMLQQSCDAIHATLVGVPADDPMAEEFQASAWKTMHVVPPNAWRPDAYHAFQARARACVQQQPAAMQVDAAGLEAQLERITSGLREAQQAMNAMQNGTPDQRRARSRILQIADIRHEIVILPTFKPDTNSFEYELNNLRGKVANAQRQLNLSPEESQEFQSGLDHLDQVLVQRENPNAPQGDPNGECPSFEAHKADFKSLLDKMQASAQKLKGLSLAELAIDPSSACTANVDQVAFYQEMLKSAQECPPTSKMGSKRFRENLAGVILMARQQGKQMGCH